MGRQSRYSPEVRERAVRLVREQLPEHSSQWAAIGSVTEKLGCKHETLRRWVRQAERDAGEYAVLAWVDWFNTRRLLEPLGYVPPAEYEARYYEQVKVA